MKNNKGLKGFLLGFLYAFRGIGKVIKEERNMRVHIAAALNVLVFSPFLGVNRTEYAVLLITSALVLSLESVNSAIENLCDRVTEKKDEYIKNTKDIAAGAVLISAIFSVITGLVILLRPEKIALLFINIFTNPIYLISFIIFEILLVIFVVCFKRKKQNP